MKLNFKSWLRQTFNFAGILNHTHYWLMDFAPLFWFPLMFAESRRLRSIKVSVYIPLPFILHIFPTEAQCHIDLISFDCGSSSWLFLRFSTPTLKNSRIYQSNSRRHKKHRNNQSDSVMLDEHWSTVDWLHVITEVWWLYSMSVLICLHTLTDQLKNRKRKKQFQDG